VAEAIMAPRKLDPARAAWLVRVLQTRPELGQDVAEGNHPVVLGRIAHGTPAGMIPVLFPSSGVASRGLQVPVWARTDPDVRPCWWDSKGFNTV